MRKVIIILLASIFVAFIVLLWVFYGVFNNYDEKVREKSNNLNPVADLSIEEAVELFNKSFVLYFMYSIGANELNNIPLTSNNPRIEIIFEDEIYSAEVINKEIIVMQNELSKKDAIIRTSKLEAVKMLKDKEYLKESFNEGLTTIELISSKAELYAKGYLRLYEQFE